jgi:hypothetical protein
MTGTIETYSISFYPGSRPLGRATYLKKEIMQFKLQYI